MAGRGRACEKAKKELEKYGRKTEATDKSRKRPQKNGGPNKRGNLGIVLWGKSLHRQGALSGDSF